MLREDANSYYWTTKFIDGLLNLFAEKVRQNLRGDNATIDYKSYIYGQLTSAIIQEGLQLCNDLKLQKQIKK